MYTCIFTSKHRRKYMCRRKYTHIYVYSHIYMNTHIYVYIYVYTYVISCRSPYAKELLIMGFVCRKRPATYDMCKDIRTCV